MKKSSDDPNPWLTLEDLATMRGEYADTGRNWLREYQSDWLIEPSPEPAEIVDWRSRMHRNYGNRPDPHLPIDEARYLLHGVNILRVRTVRRKPRPIYFPERHWR